MNILAFVLAGQTTFPRGRHRPLKALVGPGLLVGLLFAAGSAGAITYSGQVVDLSTGAGVPGVRINYSWIGAPGFVTTDSSGNWSSPGWINVGGSVTFSPEQTGYTFTPSSRSYQIGFSSVSGVNFTRVSYSISGNISRGSVGLGGVTVSLTGPLNQTASTSASGNYSFTGLRAGTYTITPSFPGFSFSPASRPVTVSPSQSGQNFSLLNPLATTLAASAVAFGNATLNGSVIGNGTLATRVWFEFGPGTNFNLSTPLQVLAAGGGSVLVSALVTNIAGGINYSFRCVAANTSSTNVGASTALLMPFPAAGNAASLDGANDYVSVSNVTSLAPGNAPHTLEAWVQPAALPPNRAGILILGQTSPLVTGGHHWLLLPSGAVQMGPVNKTGLQLNPIIPTNQWTHLAAVSDGTNYTVFTNGVAAGSSITTTGLFNLQGIPFTMGNPIVPGENFFTGRIDEVRVWNVARPAMEIQNNFQRHLTGTEPGLVAYFRFEEGTVTTTADSGPNGLVANLIGGVAFAASGALIRDPIATTLPATPVLATTATLRGTVNPSGEATTIFFEYGPSLSSLRTTVSQNVPGTGLAPVAVSALVTNLDPGTSYFFRLRAHNSFGTTIGVSQTFNTLVLGYGWPVSTKVTDGSARSPKHVVDADGNAYVAGLFTGTASLGTTLNPTGGGGTNAFIAKLARGADWMWATNIPLNASGSLRINAVALDASRNIYLAGEFSGTATFGSNVLNAAGGTDLFVAKLHFAGTNWLWAKSVGGTTNDSANALALGPTNIYVAGQFSRTNTFGPSTLISSNNTLDIFVAKIDPDGNWLWASAGRSAGSNDSARALVLDSNENIYVAGEFGGTAVFGATAPLASIGGQDLFVAKLDSSGNWLLARRGGGTSGNDVATALAIDAANQIYLLGQFTGTADYGGTLNNQNLGSAANLFVAKLNTSANVIWYAQGGAGFADSIAVDRNGRVYITGDFPFATTFGTNSFTTSGNSDVFLVQLNADSGSWTWGKKIGSTGNEFRGSIAVDAKGGVVVSGSYQNTIEVGHVLLSSANPQDIFVARLDANQVYEHNNYVIGQAITVPAEALDPARSDGAALGQPSIVILEKEHVNSDDLNSFRWSMAEKKLYPLRPVTAIIRWPRDGGGTNATLVAPVVGRMAFPEQPQIHVAGAPVELEPAVAGFPLKFIMIAFSTAPGASADAASKQFNATQPGWTVLEFLDSGGELPDPEIHPSRFEVVRTVTWNDPDHLVDNQPAIIGTALQNPLHSDPTGKNGYVYFEKSFYDGAGEDKAYDRTTRMGPIIPVNKDTTAGDDDLVVVWYRTNPSTGIAWASSPVRYLAQWPSDADELVLASGMGSGPLDPAIYPSKRVYRQHDKAMPGYNPNEEHAILFGNVLYALRNDLNAVINASEPFTLLKYQDPATTNWAMKVFHIVSTNADYSFSYTGEAGQALSLPAPLSLLSICGLSNRVVSGPGFQDHLGQLHARAAGPGSSGTNIVVQYFYPLQPDFFYRFDGQADAPVGTCVPWLDWRTGVPRDVTYAISWPANVPTLQIGETLLDAKFGLPDIRNFASAAVIFDEGNPQDTNAPNSLVRLFDPLSERTLQLPDSFTLPEGIAIANVAGRLAFSDLPYAIRSRLRYYDLHKRLTFGGLLDESSEFGGAANPLLLINVLSPRERDRIKKLSEGLDGSTAFQDAIDDLYDLTRNPNRIDHDGDGEPDQELFIGLTAPTLNTNLNVRTGPLQPEKLGDIPKALTAGPGTGSGYVTIVENNDSSLGGLPVRLHVIRVEGGPFLGDIKVINSDNVFDEKLTLRHSADFGGEPQQFEFEWYYKPLESGTDPSIFPSVLPNGNISNPQGWVQYFATPPGPLGLNDITLGDSGTSSLLVLADNYFICRYRGYVINGQTNWSDWVGGLGGGQAQLAEGWVKRVRAGLGPFAARSDAFHENETVTFASMLQQAGPRYEGDIAFNPGGGNINSIGLIEAYETVLRRAKRLSIEGTPAVNYQPANDALLLAAGFIADLYLLLGNEAVADAADPTIGFRTSSAGYGTLAPSIFTFQNQLDSLLEEELCLLRGRDDRSASVRIPPVYNRLVWNFTRDEGEVAYAQAYNITDQNHDGFINADDARIMYPQAHGDAWGHYLTATKTYYSLLQNTNFDWKPRPEEILLAGSRVKVDYLDERKFARAAAAKAKVGAEVVDLTYRLNFVDDPNGQFQGYKDTDANRAWGLSEWGERAGSAAFFDWVVANAVLPATDPNPTNTGISKIDRTTVPELAEIVSGYESVQSQVDKANAGLNPLGLAKNVVPFDIDPALIAAGKTHFEQIYDRAIEAVNNTVTVFNHANQLSQALRSLQDSVNDFSKNTDQQERDLKNRLIEVFGYPYEGDIGVGKTYPAGYDGPDLYHYMYVNPVEFTGDPEALVTNIVGGGGGLFTPRLGKLQGFFSKVSDVGVGLVGFVFPGDLPANVVLPATNVLTVEYPVAASDYSFSAPASWGRRRAPGELQSALSDILQAETSLKRAREEHSNHVQEMEDKTELLQAKYDLQTEKLLIKARIQLEVKALTNVIRGARFISKKMTEIEKKSDEITGAAVESIPKSAGTSSDVTAPVRGSIKFLNIAKNLLVRGAKFVADTVEEMTKEKKDFIEGREKQLVDAAEFHVKVQEELKELEKMLREEDVKRYAMLEQAQKLDQIAGAYEAALAKGLRLIEDRVTFRKNAAAETQASRYQDMTFRIFRNDAIQKYRAQFDVAARYVFLAAVAYDYETQLLGGRSGAGSAFLTDIVRQRALGEVINGVPVAGRHGLADPLARLNQNFGVLKGQLGFNNPQTETGRFSLRSELFRISTNSHEAWRTELRKSVVPNLWDVPEFRRYCRPFAPESAGPQPGLVIRFPTTINFGFNYFGWPLGGGDSAYDPTLFATKVRSAGVWFSDYNGSHLSATPRVYLVPAGADIMRSPSGNNLETREWRVVDQKIPVPFPIGFSSLNNSAWIPMNDSLSDTFGDVRRFSSFRAYNDSGGFTTDEATTDSRLIGRSVWNTDWMLVIPGGTFLFDPNQGLDTFINSVSDIKIFFQTYAYSGN